MIRRLLLAPATAILAWTGLLGAADATPALPKSPQPAYTYDAPDNDAVSKRGPPAQGHELAAYDAVDRWSNGTAALLDGSTSRATHTCNTSAGYMQVARDTATTPTGVRACSGGLLSPRRTQVAAKACSFSGTTVVLMADGSRKPIQDVRVGDKVIATDPETGERVTRRVTKVWAHDDILTDLKLGDGTILTTTEDHPYWSVTDHTFERADHLSSGEVVVGDNGREVTVVGFEAGTAHTALAYNLSIAGVHTYHVGPDAVLVHNTCRGLWNLTKEGSSRMMHGGPFRSTFYKSASDGTWWTKDVAGHGGSAFKVYRETGKGLEWISDADQYGEYIVGKWKGGTGRFIDWDALGGVG